MRLVGRGCLAAAVVLFFVCTAQAQSFKMWLMQDELSERLEQHLAGARVQCRADFTGGYDWTAAPAEQIEKESRDAMHCAAAAEAIPHLCAADSGQASVAAKINRFECRFGDPAVKLENGTLTVSVRHRSHPEDRAFEEVNYNELVKSYLLDNL